MRKYFLIIASMVVVQWAVAQNYYVYVTAESEDEVALIKFDGKDATVAATIPIGVWPAEIEGPHGINVSPDGKYWYLSVAHGNPFGFLYKYSTETNEVISYTTLGLFPASLQVSTATGLIYCVNFNLHGDMVPSTVSVVDPENMIELAQIETGIMPHGSRLSPDGLFQYSVGMMSGELFEIDAMKLKVSRVLNLDVEEEMDHSKMDHSAHADHNMATDNAQGMEKASAMSMPMKHSKTKPTWVIPHPTERKAYVAGNGSNEILEIDLDNWKVSKRLPGGKAPYNADVSANGEILVVTYKAEAATGIWNLKTGTEVGRVKNTRKVTHGVTISPDSKYAFVSVEGIGGEPGSVDVIDLTSNELVSSAEVGKQAGGIIFWKMEE